MDRGAPDAGGAPGSPGTQGRSEDLFVRTVHGERLRYAFCVGNFDGHGDVHGAILRGGGVVVSQRKVADADFIIGTQRLDSAPATAAPTCHPQFIADSVRAGRIQDHRDYAIAGPAQDHHHRDYADGDDDDGGAAGLRGLYGDEPLEPDDRVMDSFLSSQSHDVSDYLVRRPESPGAQSVNSVDISDSDYRTKRTLDKAARNIGYTPVRGSPLAPRAPPKSAPQSRPQPATLRATLASRKSPSFVSARSVFECPRPSDAAPRAPASAPRRTAGRLPTSRAPSYEHAVDWATPDGRRTRRSSACSPELEMPATQAPTSDSFVFSIDSNDQDESQELIGNDTPRREPADDAAAIELVDDLSELECPDPLDLLATHRQGPLGAAPLCASRESSPGVDAAGGAAQEPAPVAAAHSPAGSRAPSPAPTPPRSALKRRRPSDAELGYGEQALPVVSGKRPAPMPSAPSPALGPKQLSQPAQEKTPAPAVKMRSLESFTIPNRRRSSARRNGWPASKRIRMSGSPTAEGEAAEVDAPHSALPAYHASEPPAEAPPAPEDARGARLSAPAEGSSDSLAAAMPAARGSQAPDAPSQADPLAAAAGADSEAGSDAPPPRPPPPLETGSSQVTVPVPSATPDLDAADPAPEARPASRSPTVMDVDSAESAVPVMAPVPAVPAAATPPPTQASPQLERRLAATAARSQRPAAPRDPLRRQTLDPPARPRRLSSARRISICQRLLELDALTKGAEGQGALADPAPAPGAGAASVPGTPSRRAAFSGTMRVLGESEPVLSDMDRLRYMRKVKGLIEGTDLSAREALRILYFFTGDWVSARRHILLGPAAPPESCMWSAAEDSDLLRCSSPGRLAELREQKGDVEVYRRLQFLNTFHGAALFQGS
ncbi:hypothetical protein H4R18_004411 [Coemansia javaensis]|uniref:BRCT domain-containing protein n=1 Tax=Coemansia javaensis TaxID=2761396 RepID=A0A9W8LH54_9FUNG|nr:hypothetical protein H4R18_004411 [Coemansia javaensis]